MILADTSVWVGHLRTGDRQLEHDLGAGSIVIHPFVIGEIALGHLRARSRVLQSLRELPMTAVASDAEVFHLIESTKLFGRGIGYVDAHLLAAVRLTRDAMLWTRDRQLRQAAHQLGLACHGR